MPRNVDGQMAAGGCAALIGIVLFYLAFVSALVWLIATIVHGVFF